MKNILFILLAVSLISARLGAQVPAFSITSPANGQLLQYNSTTGAWQNVSTSVLAANPTALSGPTAVNGTATTFMTSDSAPAINLTAAYTWTGVHVFNGTGGLGVGANPSAAPNSIGTLVYMTRTTAPASSTVGTLQYNYYALTPVDATTVNVTGLFDLQLNGADALGAGHSIAMIARASDTSSDVGAQFSGAEFKRQAYGASDNGSAAWGDALYNMASATNRWATGFMSTAEFFNGTPSTPIVTGGFVAFHAQTPGFGTTEGDSTKFWSMIGDANFKLQTGGIIASYSGATPTYGSLAAAYIAIQHNGTDGTLTTSSGNLQMGGAGGFIIAQTGQSLVPLTTGGALGITTNRWALTATTIAANGALTFSGAQAANGSVATTTTSLGPAGSHTTIQEWLVVNDGTNTRYIPEY